MCRLPRNTVECSAYLVPGLLRQTAPFTRLGNYLWLMSRHQLSAHAFTYQGRGQSRPHAPRRPPAFVSLDRCQCQQLSQQALSLRQPRWEAGQAFGLHFPPPRPRTCGQNLAIALHSPPGLCGMSTASSCWLIVLRRVSRLRGIWTAARRAVAIEWQDLWSFVCLFSSHSVQALHMRDIVCGMAMRFGVKKGPIPWVFNWADKSISTDLQTQ